MSPWTALERLESLSLVELRQARHLFIIEEQNYARVTRNYPADRMARFGQPRLDELRGALASINARVREVEQALQTSAQPATAHRTS